MSGKPDGVRADRVGPGRRHQAGAAGLVDNRRSHDVDAHQLDAATDRPWCAHRAAVERLAVLDRNVISTLDPAGSPLADALNDAALTMRAHLAPHTPIWTLIPQSPTGGFSLCPSTEHPLVGHGHAPADGARLSSASAPNSISAVPCTPAPSSRTRCSARSVRP
jgi:hypothetical protein